MHLLSLEGISKSYPEMPVLSNVSLGISTRDHIGVIGRNGSGKSTLLAIISGHETIDSGSIIRSRGLRVAHLDQNPTFAEGDTVGQIIGSDRRTIALADRLGLTDPDAFCSSLSGGERKRLALALTLSAECDLLVLDEPTNHLDVDLIDWLEDHLRARPEALVLVTHDRYLLDRVATRVIEVHDQGLYSHNGTYEEFLEAATRRSEHEARVEHRLQRRIATELEWLRRSPKARTTKSRAKVERVQDLLARQNQRVRQEFTIDLPSRRIGSKVVELDDVGKQYDGRWVLRHVDYKLLRDSRVGIVGPNAAGKTTLLKLISGQIAPDEGTIALGSTVHSGWYGQDPRTIRPDTRVHAAVSQHRDQVLLSSGVRVSGAKLLERFQFTREQQQSEVGDLSGGERRRLELLLSLMEAPNLLLLDEPTNDLDIDTLNILEEYLDVWDGVVVVSSHDRFFLERTCRDLLSIEPDGSVRHHPGGWSAYRAAIKEPGESDPPPDDGVERAKQPLRKLTYRDQRELDQLEATIPGLEEKKRVLAARLEAAAGDYRRSTELAHSLSEAIATLEQAESRWLELIAKAETLGKSEA